MRRQHLRAEQAGGSAVGVGDLVDEQVRTAVVQRRGDDDLPASLAGELVALDVLLPFTGTGLLRVPTDSGTKDSLVRPGPQWPVLLAAGRIAEVLGDAARRLRIAGLRHVIDPRSGDRDGMALAAVLLLRISDPDRAAALRRVAALPQASPNQESTP